MSVKLVSREEWGARPPVKVKLLKHPIPFVCLSYNDDCLNVNYELLRAIQKSHIETLGMYDIQSNFLVTHDGIVYEGRGWENQPAKMFGMFEKYNGQFIDITVLGRFKEDYSTRHPAYASVMSIFQFGVLGNVLAQDFKFIQVNEKIYQRTLPS